MTKKFKIDNAEKIRDSIEEGRLRDILDNYCKSITSILYTPNIPFLCMVAGYEQAMSKFLPLADKPDFLTLPGFEEKDPKKTAHALIEHFKQKIDANRKEGEEILKDLLIEFIAEDEQFGKAYYSIIHGTLVNAWTIFEAVTKDLWKFLLNSYPDKFFHSIISSNDPNLNQIDGLSGKQISVSLLAKYNFDLSRSLGDLLSIKYDFTSPKGIKTAFQHILNCSTTDLKFLENEHLIQLENIRHLMVHNAGIIDEQYLRRSIYKNEKLGESLEIKVSQIDGLINSNIDAVVGLYKLINKRI